MNLSFSKIKLSRGKKGWLLHLLPTQIMINWTFIPPPSSPRDHISEIRILFMQMSIQEYWNFSSRAFKRYKTNLLVNHWVNNLSITSWQERHDNLSGSFSSVNLDTGAENPVLANTFPPRKTKTTTWKFSGILRVTNPFKFVQWVQNSKDPRVMFGREVYM